MTLTETELYSIETDLVAGVTHHNRRRRQRYTMAAVPVVAVIAGVGAVLVSGDDKPAYAMIQRPEGVIEVEILPDFDDAETLRSDLVAAGLDAAVVQLRAHPSLDGVAEVVSHDNEPGTAMEFSGSRFSIDVGQADGLVEILLYTEADSGEDYQAAPSLFAPGQALGGMHCAYTDAPLSTEAVETALNEAGYNNIEWTVFGAVDAETGYVPSEDHDDRPEGFVTNVELRNESTVFVGVQEETGPAADTIVMHDGTHYRQRPVCTPELAEPWQ